MHKYLANIISFLRIIISMSLPFITIFSKAFWIVYIIIGLSDIFDGYIARRLNTQSSFGALLDSISDFIFSVVLAIILIINIVLPRWLWICIIIITIIKIASYLIGGIKYHAFSALHTYSNKITGLLIYLSPLMFFYTNIIFTGIILFIVALISSIEELLIVILSTTLDRNRKSLFN